MESLKKMVVTRRRRREINWLSCKRKKIISLRKRADGKKKNTESNIFILYVQN